MVRRLPFTSQIRNVLAGYPLLIGTSPEILPGIVVSKNLNILDRPAKERDYATAISVELSRHCRLSKDSDSFVAPVPKTKMYIACQCGYYLFPNPII